MGNVDRNIGVEEKERKTTGRDSAVKGIVESRIIKHRIFILAGFLIIWQSVTVYYNIM